MPGHKGNTFMGMEKYDVTEIRGADSLFEANGIIKESETNAGALFGARSFYSAEGSSLSIRAMLYLATLYAKSKGVKPLILAARNAHRAFVSAAALLDFDIEWLYPDKDASYLSCVPEPSSVDKRLCEMSEKPVALYLTSPDYLGNICDIAGLSAVCKNHGVLLLVDNAHGAYLKFLPKSYHPIDHGADACCDSAHKTLPALTGAAYLHISYTAPAIFSEFAKTAMASFASTSPSYLILSSLDALNAYLADGYEKKLASFVERLDLMKSRLRLSGYETVGDEPMKLTLRAKSYGYYGYELDSLLSEKKIICEFSDPDFVVMMFTPEISFESLDFIEKTLLSIPKRKTVEAEPPALRAPKRILSPREAMLSPSEAVPSDKCVGKILAETGVSCPPAVPIGVSGELIDERMIKCFEYYGIKECRVVKNNE